MRLIVEADGGSRGNPGPAGYGALVRNAETGAIVARRNGFLGVATNNVAEYQGLLAGLRAAAEIDPTATLEVRMDSKLVVEQMSGRWQVKHPTLRPLVREGASLAAAFGAARFTWIPRAQNGAADALANEAMDARRATHDALDDPDPDSTQAPAPEPPAVGGWAAPRGPATTLVLLRHGQTPLSPERRFSGLGDPQLTELGIEQALRVAGRLARRGGIDAIVSSPLGRARQTADAVAAATGLPLAEDPDWREIDFGRWEGRTAGEVRRDEPEAMSAWLADERSAPHGGESFAAVTDRVRTARDAVVAANPGRTVLVVSHVTPIKVVARLALIAGPDALYRMHLDLCSISTVDVFPDGGGIVRGLNDTAHLED